MEQSFLTDIKLQRLSCPFTWGMEDVIKNRNNLLETEKIRFESVVDIQDIFPEFVLVWHVLMAYENAMSDKLEDAMHSIDEAELSLADIEKKETLRNVENILEHICVATKCHVLKKLGQVTEIDQLLKNIRKLEDIKIDKKEAAMLNGCQCLAWSLYRTSHTLEAINFAKEAIQCESTNGKWYYLLGKNYRQYRRRQQSISQKPNQDEIMAFQQAYKLSENILFGVSLARLYRESSKFAEANKIYRDIYDLQPTCCQVRLQLALGFIRAREFKLAKRCLDFVAESLPNSLTYTHYMGIYEEKCNGDLKAALSYYQTAVDNFNYGAEWQYLDCRKRIEPDWDPLPHLLEVLEKYKSDSSHVIQEINIQIGTYYLFEKRDIFSACLSLAKAIKINPNARILKSHHLLFGQRIQVNIYHVVKQEIQFAVQGRTTNHDDDTTLVLQDTLQLCRKYNKDLPSPSVQSLPGFTRSQSLNYSQNRCQSSDSRRGIDRRRNTMTSMSQSSAGNYSQRSRANPQGLFERNSRDWRIKDKPQELNSQSIASGSSSRHHIPQRSMTRFQERNDSSKSSSLQKTESSRDELYRPLHTRTNTVPDLVPVTRMRKNPSSKPRDKFDSLEDEAGCLLVKTKNLKL